MRRFIASLAVVVTAAAGLAVAPPHEEALAVQPGAIYSCQHDGLAARRVDPIVNPGEVSAHPHVFAGAVGVTADDDTSAELRELPTRCVETSNHSAYWMPEPSMVVNGQRVALKMGTTSRGGGKHFLGYYRCVFSASACRNLASFPDDTKLVVGYSGAQSPDDNPLLGSRIIFKCGPGSGTDLPHPPSSCASGVLSISFRFGPCLNVATMQHVDPQRGECPSGYVKVPRLEQFFRYWVGKNVPIVGLQLGGMPWYTAHSDYEFGWDRAAFERFMDSCIRALVGCSKNFNV